MKAQSQRGQHLQGHGMTSKGTEQYGRPNIEALQVLRAPTRSTKSSHQGTQSSKLHCRTSTSISNVFQHELLHAQSKRCTQHADSAMGRSTLHFVQFCLMHYINLESEAYATLLTAVCGCIGWQAVCKWREQGVVAQLEAAAGVMPCLAAAGTMKQVV